MATLSDIRNEVGKRSLPDEIRRSYLKKLGEYTKRDTVVYASSFSSPNPNIPSSAYSIELNDLQAFMAVFHGLKRKNLDIILHSPGGSLEAADQIVQYIRRKYDHIRAIIPQNAMSAATMIACAADEIIMGKESALGPTDPLLNGASAHAVLSEFAQARSEVIKDPKTAPIWVSRIANWPPGFLDSCQKALDLSQEKVFEWLSNYMFKGENNDKPREIAKWLADARQHKTHARPLGIDLLQEKGLKVIPLEEDQEFQEIILSVFHSTIVTFESTSCIKLVENHEGKGSFLQFRPQMLIPPVQGNTSTGK